MLQIIKPNAEHYKIDAQGRIMRQHWNDSGAFLAPSKEWTMRGIVHVKKSIFIPFSELTPERVKGLELLYKNGRPQWTVVDLDHGTRREWGNTHFHGIKHLYFE